MTKGIIIVGYGTRTGNLTEIIERQADRLRARGRPNVYVAYFRVSEPTIQAAVKQAVAEGRIAQSRYNSYLSLLNDEDEDKYRQGAD